MRLSRRRLLRLGSVAALARVARPDRHLSAQHLSARDLFLLDSRANGPLALRYSLLRKTADGSAREEDPRYTFHSGDRFRFRIEVNDTAYLYVIQHGSSGSWRTIFPSPESLTGNLVDRGPAYDIPEDVWFEFDNRPGEEKLFIVCSRRPESAIESQFHPAASRALKDEVVAAIRRQARSRDLALEENSHVIYVADRSGGPDSRLTLD